MSMFNNTRMQYLTNEELEHKLIHLTKLLGVKIAQVNKAEKELQHATKNFEEQSKLMQNVMDDIGKASLTLEYRKRG